jgi:hypothetical protein
MHISKPVLNNIHVVCRDSFGESSIAGDKRWAGSYGVSIDFVARSHCSVEIILIEDIQASAWPLQSQKANIYIIITLNVSEISLPASTSTMVTMW